MKMRVNSEYLNLMKDRINLRQIPFSERGSRLLIFQSNGYLTFRLAERWFRREGQLSAFGGASAVFIDLAIEAAREKMQ